MLRFVRLPSLFKTEFLECGLLQIRNLAPVNSLFVALTGTPVSGRKGSLYFSTLPVLDDPNDREIGKMNLAENLACLVEESPALNVERPKNRMELKRSLELSIKKRVKGQYVNGRFENLMQKVIANPETLKDSYNIIRLNSNLEITESNVSVSFESMAQQLSCGTFDINGNTFAISSKGARKEVIVLPNLKLKVVQEAIRVVLEQIYKPFFSKISHGCRSGRGHSTALKYIRKDISNPDWWFTLLLNKKIDACVLEKLTSIMENRIDDPMLYDTIRKMFDAKVLNLEFGGFPKGQGLPQEGVLSPILMNIYLDVFDHEFYKLSMRYEALNPNFNQSENVSQSKLRSWFRRQLNNSDLDHKPAQNLGPRIHACRVMDEMLFVVSGSKEVALAFRSDVVNYLRDFLYLNIDDEADILPCEGSHGIRFLGTLVRRSVKESPAVKVVHKLKEKVKLFALQKQEAWDAGTVRIGKKWLAHGLKKVKESEIKHLVDSGSTLSKISRFRKAGMKTDHWYKVLLKAWMHDVKAKAIESEETLIAEHVVEPALPQELKDSFYRFQKCAEEYVSSETAAALALLPESCLSTKPVIFTEVLAPLDAIKKRLLRYGLTTSEGYSRPTSLLILLDNIQIIDWFSGLVRRWLKWYSEFDNFNEVKLIISNEIRRSCIRTLAAKYRIHESQIEKKFDSELSRIPSTLEIEQEMTDEMSNSHSYERDEALMYGISYTGLCLLSLARMVSESRPCNCFVMGCSSAAPSVYTLHVMERQKYPGWKTGFSSCIHPSLNKRRIVNVCFVHNLEDVEVALETFSGQRTWYMHVRTVDGSSSNDIACRRMQALQLGLFAGSPLGVRSMKW